MRVGYGAAPAPREGSLPVELPEFWIGDEREFVEALGTDEFSPVLESLIPRVKAFPALRTDGTIFQVLALSHHAL